MHYFNKFYNPEDERIIVALSENIGQIHAFGGGGTLVSISVAKRLTEEKVAEGQRPGIDRIMELFWLFDHLS